MADPRIGAAASWMMARAPQSSTIYGTATAATNLTSAQMLIYELRFAAAKSIRTSTIILASFNAVAAFATAGSILYDAYSARKRNRMQHQLRNQTPFIQSAEIYPLVVSFGIMIQGIVFAVAQAQGLSSIFTFGCTLVAQFMLPAIFLVPYIQLVFALDFAARGLRKKPFPPRGKYRVTVCLVLVGMLVLVNFLVADFIRAPNFCLASLFWFVAIYSRGNFAALLVIDILLLLCAIAIAVQLTRSIEIETTERVAASRMVYYLVLAILSITLIIPFFFAVGFDKRSLVNGQALNMSMVASVVANVTGLTTGGLHLFLRSTMCPTIGPCDKLGEDQRQRMKGRIRHYPGSSDPDFSGHMMGAVNSAADERRIRSSVNLISNGKEDEEADTWPRPTTASSETTIRVPEPVGVSTAAKIVIEPPETSDTLLSGSTKRGTAMSNVKSMLLLLPATTYSPNAAKKMSTSAAAAAPASTSHGRFDFSSLKPPPSMNNLVGRRHRRDSSIVSSVSSATVQIGLRLSNLDDMNMAPTQSQFLDKKVYSLGYGNGPETLAGLGALPTAESGMMPPPVPPPVQRPSPLATMHKANPSVEEPRDERQDSEVSEDDDDDDDSELDSIYGTQAKTLPPVPLLPRRAMETEPVSPISPVSSVLPVPMSPMSPVPSMSLMPPTPLMPLMPAALKVPSNTKAEEISLSPSVYSPPSMPNPPSPQSPSKPKVPSPRGVGFVPVPARSNSKARQPQPLQPPTAVSPIASPGKRGGDWI